MEKALFLDLKKSLKFNNRTTLNYLTHTYRYHNVFPPAYTKSILSLLCKKLETSNPSSKNYPNFLCNLCRFCSLLSLSNLTSYKFKDFFLKFNGEFSWSQLNSISSFLNYSKIKDQQCLNHFSEILCKSILKVQTEQSKPNYYYHALVYFFKNEDLKKEKLCLLLQKYSFFKNRMNLEQKIFFFLLWKNNENSEISKLYTTFLEEEKLLMEILANINEISISLIVKTWYKCLELKVGNEELFNFSKVEIMQRKNLLNEEDILVITKILALSNLPLEQKKALAEIVKKTMFEKINNKTLKIQKYYSQTFFLLALKNLELITSEEIEEFYFRSFFLNPNPLLLKTTLVNMINFSGQNFEKTNKFLMWNISQIMSKLDKIPSNKLLEMLNCLKSFIKIKRDILLSLDLYVTHKLIKKKKNNENEKNDNNKEILKHETLEFFSMKMLQFFLNKEIKNNDSLLDFNKSFHNFLNLIKKHDFSELLIEIPFNSEHVSWIDNINKELLTKILESEFAMFFEEEKMNIINLFYGTSEKLNKLFIKVLKSQLPNLSEERLCQFFWIFATNPKIFPIEEIQTKFFSQRLSISKIDHLLTNINKVELPLKIIQSVQDGLINFSHEKNLDFNFYTIGVVIKIFNNKKFFEKEFLETLKKKVLIGDFRSSEYSMNELFKIMV